MIGNRTPGLNRTAQTAAAGQLMHGVALAIGAGRFQNRRDQDPQPNHHRQGPPQAGAGSLHEHGGPGHGERPPQQGQAGGLMFAD